MSLTLRILPSLVSLLSIVSTLGLGPVRTDTLVGTARFGPLWALLALPKDNTAGTLSYFSNLPNELDLLNVDSWEQYPK